MKNCSLHPQKKLSLFCESCSDIICLECSQYNPHSGSNHEIKTIEEAVQNRKLSFQKYLTDELNPLREAVMKKLSKIKQIQQNQQALRNTIRKDIQLEFESIDSRLEMRIQKERLRLITEIKHFQEYLNCLDDLEVSFSETVENPYGFLMLYHEFMEKIEYLESRGDFVGIIDKQMQKSRNSSENEIKQNDGGNENSQKQNNEQGNEASNILKDVFTNNPQRSQQEQRFQEKKLSSLSNQEEQRFHRKFPLLSSIPRQAAEATARINQQLPQIYNKNLALNGLIVKATSHYQQKLQQSTKQSIENKKSILHYYNTVNQNILSTDRAKICIFCGESFFLQLCNDQCSQNKSIRQSSGSILPGYEHIQIDQEQKGTKRHFWVGADIRSRRIPNIQMNEHVLIRNKIKKEFNNSLKDLSVVGTYFRRYEIEATNGEVLKMSYMKVFEEADKEKKGYLSRINIRYILTKVFNVEDVHCQFLVNCLSFYGKLVKSCSERIREKSSGEGENVGSKRQFERGQTEQKQQVKPEEELSEKNKRCWKEIPEGFIEYGLIPEVVEDPLVLLRKFTDLEEEVEKQRSVAPKSQQTKRYRY